ncbi:MAG TPA: tetratricopeptide repeat protein [Vicinamibacterales bacterium]|nr:tetratricopeptide repeat protein [Vicinamibacterales bacterium]
MRRYVAALLVLAAATAAGAGLYTVYANDRDYARLIADGDRALAAEQPFQALEAYSGAIGLRPDSMVAHLKRGITYHDRGELTAAVKDLRRAADLDPTATVPAELLGDTNLALERYERAAERYQAYLALDDRTARVWYKLGLARYRAGAPVHATDALRQAVSLDKTLAEAHYLLGLCLRDQGQLDLAQASLDTAIRLEPALTGPREALAGVYAAADDHPHAIDQLAALAALDPSRPERVVALGLAHARSRRHEAAVVTLSRAVERFPDEPQVYAALGRVWLESAEATRDRVALKKAVEALTAAASHSDASSETLTDLGRAHQLGGDTAAAERALRQATTRLPVRPDAFLDLAALATRGGRAQEARDALLRYAMLIGESEPIGGVATQIATLSITLGEPRVALRWIERAEDETGASLALQALRRRAKATSLLTSPAPSWGRAGHATHRPKS